MSEVIWIYSLSLKLNLVKVLLQHFPQARVTENELQLIETSKHHVVIVISQMSIEVIKQLNRDNTYLYIGVRGEHEGLNTFETSQELNHLLHEREKQKLEQIQLDYLSGLGPLNQEESKYLECLMANKGFQPQGILQPKQVGAEKKIKPNKVKHYKGIIAVYDNPQFAVSLASAFKIKSLLLMEGNLLKPTLDDMLGISKIETHVESHLTGLDNTGLNIALDSMRKQANLKQDLNYIVKRHQHFDVLLGNYNVLNYEHYDPDQIKQLIDVLSSLYECIIISLGDNLYDYLTLLSLNKSDINILCVDDTKSDVRWIKQMIELLKSKQFIEPSKHYVYKIKRSFKPPSYSDAVMKALFKGQYKGLINLKKKSAFNKVIKEIVK